MIYECVAYEIRKLKAFSTFFQNNISKLSKVNNLATFRSSIISNISILQIFLFVLIIVIEDAAIGI